MHPRRTYFYLTTYAHQPIPDPHTNPFPQRAIISPSLSSAASRSDEADAERRRELSPSPEVDLSSPEFDDEDMVTPPTPTGSFSGRLESVRNTRASSPPLEKDEKEFTQTARGMQKRKLSGDDTEMSGVPSDMEDHPTKNLDADVLFGEGRNLGVTEKMVFVSSPAMKPSLALNTLKRGFEENDLWARVEGAMEWDLRSPENVELEELDGMLDDF